MRMMLPATILLGVIGMVQAARADAIDGAWCHDRGSRIVINGAAITTPGGRQTSGDYSRHAFSYVAPAGDPDAGATIAMVLLNEQTMRLRPPQGPEETWRRCGPPVS